MLLPLRYNDGTLIEREKFADTVRELARRFRGLTIVPEPVFGLWTHDGQLFLDASVRFEIAVEDTAEHRRFFEEYKETLKARFQQIDIWITGTSIDIL